MGGSTSRTGRGHMSVVEAARLILAAVVLAGDRAGRRGGRAVEGGGLARFLVEWATMLICTRLVAGCFASTGLTIYA